MTEGKKYYWLKLKRDFFKRHDIKIIEDMENGKDYILFYLKLLVESVDHNGNLRFSDTIPYNDKMLASLTDTNIDIVRSALKIFTELRMIEVLDDETIYMSQVNHMIGSETEWAEKKRKQRDKKNQISPKGENVPPMSSMCPPDVRQEIDKDKDIDIDIDIDIDTPPISPPWGFDTHTNKENFKYLIESGCEFSEQIQKDLGLFECIQDWMEYKDARKPKSSNHYANEKSMLSLLKKIVTNSGLYGAPAVIGVIEDSMANNYQGIIWDKLTKAKQGKQSTEEYWRSV